MDIPNEFWAGLLRPLFWLVVLGGIAWIATFLPERVRRIMFKKLF